MHADAENGVRLARVVCMPGKVGLRATVVLKFRPSGFAMCRPLLSLQSFILFLLKGLCNLDRGQTKEICEKQEKYFKGKVVQSLILYQYPVSLLTYLELY